MSTKPLLNLQQLKTLYKKGVEYARTQFNSPLYTENKSLTNYQMKLIEKAPDITTFMNCFWIPNLMFQNAFEDPKQICNGCELKYTGVRFGVGSMGWYFIFGIAGNYVYNFTLFRLDVCPPYVLEKENIPRSEASRWFVCGGYGEVNGNFYKMQNEAIYMKYNQPTYSTFGLEGSGNSYNCRFGSQVPMQFYFSVDFTDTDGKSHSVTINLRANTPPLPNYKNACLCAPGAGAFYYSYTDVWSNISVNGSEPSVGTGWIDHELFKMGILKSFRLQALNTVLSTFNKTETQGWIWIPIVDKESGIQYMLTHHLKEFYYKSIKPNNTYSLDIVNVYNKGVAYISPTSSDMDSRETSITLTSTFQANDLNLPAGYKITLPGGKKVIAKIASSPNVYPSIFAPTENPAFLYDETGQKIIGIALLETNVYLTYKQIAKRAVQFCGGDPNNNEEVEIMYSGFIVNQTWGQKLLAYLYLLIPVFLILFAVIFVLYRKDNRYTRLMFSIALLLIIWGLSYTI